MDRAPRDLVEWSRRIAAMKQCRTADELRRRYGAPGHVERHEAIEIWHYPLGVFERTLYSIHVSVPNDPPNSPPQPYLHVVPTDRPDTVAARPWWRFW